MQCVALSYDLCDVKVPILLRSESGNNFSSKLHRQIVIHISITNTAIIYRLDKQHGVQW